MVEPPKAAPKAYSYLRMSTDVQLKGHGKQRQLEESKRYANAHGLELADGAQVVDIGISAFKGANVSAFKGANVKDGALGQFLDAVKSGKVPKGSYLLVESLDRLSRQEILPSLTLFLTIIGAGITLVTLQDERVYDQRSRADDLIISLTIMSRAHEESQLKSKRVGAAWANKRANAHQRKLTKWCPAWLRLSADRREYEIISRQRDT
jgi:DNA invertase Pin-like site-specific DNA recombinase